MKKLKVPIVSLFAIVMMLLLIIAMPLSASSPEVTTQQGNILYACGNCHDALQDVKMIAAVDSAPDKIATKTIADIQAINIVATNSGINTIIANAEVGQSTFLAGYAYSHTDTQTAKITVTAKNMEVAEDGRLLTACAFNSDSHMANDTAALAQTIGSGGGHYAMVDTSATFSTYIQIADNNTIGSVVYADLERMNRGSILKCPSITYLTKMNTDINGSVAFAFLERTRGNVLKYLC